MKYRLAEIEHERRGEEASTRVVPFFGSSSSPGESESWFAAGLGGLQSLTNAMAQGGQALGVAVLGELVVDRRQLLATDLLDLDAEHHGLTRDFRAAMMLRIRRRNVRARTARRLINCRRE